LITPNADIGKGFVAHRQEAADLDCPFQQITEPVNTVSDG